MCVVVVASGNIWLSVDSGVTWEEKFGSTQEWSAITASSDFTLLVAAVYNGRFWHSSDSGASWVENLASPGAIHPNLDPILECSGDFIS